MPLRLFHLPADFQISTDLIPSCFQYPENPAWSLQADEVQNIVDSLNGFRRLWPLVRLAQWLSPPLRDAMYGYIWEEGATPVGLVNYGRIGQSGTWWIGNVGVLPAFRRRGIARQLVEAAIDGARQHQAQAIILDVIVGNLPAYNLYVQLGFEHFSGEINFDYDRGDPLPACPLPDGFAIERHDVFDWRPRYQLAQRVTPESVRVYNPVTESRYRQPALLRPVNPLINGMNGYRVEAYAVYGPPHGSPGTVVATCGCQARTRAGGTNSVFITLDPMHEELAACLITFLINRVQQLAPGRRVEFPVSTWQKSVIEAAVALGLSRRNEMATLGRHGR